MATTDQLKKAERKGAAAGIFLNSFSRAAYLKAVKAAGYFGVDRLTKAELFRIVLNNNLPINQYGHENG